MEGGGLAVKSALPLPRAQARVLACAQMAVLETEGGEGRHAVDAGELVALQKEHLEVGEVMEA